MENVDCEAEEDEKLSTSNTTLVEYCASRTAHFSSYNYSTTKNWVHYFERTSEICKQEVKDDLETLKDDIAMS